MTAEQNAFLQSVVPAAQQAQRVYGVPASITIAQAILESGWGRSGLAARANNYFGVKAAPGADPQDYAEFPTEEWIGTGAAAREQTVPARFARYATAADSFAAHARLLFLAPRYRPAMECRENAAQFALRLQACGYSTSRDPKTGLPDYALRLMALVRQFDLTQYDQPPEPPAQAQQEAA